MTTTTNVFVTLRYRGNKVPGAHAKADATHPYILYHDKSKRLSWELTINVGDILGFTWPFDEKASGANPVIFGKKTLLGYAVPSTLPLDRAERLIKAFKPGTAKHPTCLVTVRGRSKALYFEFLRMLRSAKKDETSFAAPDGKKIAPGKISADEQAAYLKMFDGLKETSRDLYTDYTYENVPATVKAAIVSLSGTSTLILDVSMEVLGGSVTVKPSDEPDDRVARLVATSWTDLEQLGAKSNGKKITEKIRPEHEESFQYWSLNVVWYFLNYTNLQRGRETLQAIIDRGISKAAAKVAFKDIVESVRDDIDVHLVTANAWIDPRENPKNEPYQHLLQRKVGDITKHRPSAGPLNLFRDMVNVITRDEKARGLGGTFTLYDDTAAWVLQAGLAHCGEHAIVSFLVLVAIFESKSKPSEMTSIYLCGEVLVDHAMVLVGLRAKVGKRLPGKFGVFFDLAEAIEHFKVSGTVCDPYLEKRYPTGEVLRDAIKKKGTTMLKLIQWYPKDMGPMTMPKLEDEEKKLFGI